jgi:hypothetical protein
MEQSPNSYSASLEIPWLSWNMKIYYVQKSLLLVAMLRQMNSDHNSPSHFSKIHYNIILPSKPRSSK